MAAARSADSMEREVIAVGLLLEGRDCGYYCRCGFAVALSPSNEIVHFGTLDACEVA